LLDIKKWINPKSSLIDFYSGVGTIGLTNGQNKTTHIESNESAVTEMRNNIKSLNKNATAILAEAEKAFEYIDDKSTIILDPPRAGLNSQVTSKLLQILPPRIIYLSCNP
jgi:tRNA/tmRNA/rRNA uracil-C5-methylase (TrmA/RlmC/RlmD family)